MKRLFTGGYEGIIIKEFPNIRVGVGIMDEISSIKGIEEKLQTAMGLPKCRKCGCMEETLKTIKAQLSKTMDGDFSELLSEVENSIRKMEPTAYT